MFEGFETVRTDVVHARVGGSGPPVLLLHGYPQTHAMWHRFAPALAADHTVVVADLRGYGDSARPAGGYDKRTMAADQAALMTQLGFEQFAVVGHDRGARVTHRLCLDHPDRVTRAVVMDITPTRHMFGTADREFGAVYYHWFFLAQPPGLPERLIGADPEYWLRYHLDAWSRVPGAFDDEAMAEYLRCFADPQVIRASCEDYRAGIGVDLEQDDASAGERVACPLLVLWGGQGFVGHKYDVLSVWREYADDVSGSAIDCGHFLPEERPAETLAAVREFLATERPG